MTVRKTTTCSPSPCYDDDDASTVILTPTMRSLEQDAAQALLMLTNSDERSVGDGITGEGLCADDLSEERHSFSMESDEGDSDTGKLDYSDDGPTGYYEFRTNDTLAGWTYSRHPGSICLTPPRAWLQTPYEINVQWYKRPLFYSGEHGGYFMSDAQCFVNKVEELGALYNQERVWGDAN